MFTQIKINNFRVIQDKTFVLGKYITMFSGWNATGKSTLLALLANATELKKNKGVTYNDQQFRAEFSEILKGSKSFDKVGPNKLEVEWKDDISEKTRNKVFRTAWQKNDRFRVIPKEICSDGKKSEAKFEFPVIYLGLSRLYPLGEMSDSSITNHDFKFKTIEDEEWFKVSYMSVMSQVDNINHMTNVVSKFKDAFGINTQTYDWHTNSAGQDNLSKILISILSFRNLKRNLGSNFKGGLFVIDELEASFHPIAQRKIVEILIKEAKNTGFQVVFTTHSPTIMEEISKKVKTDNSNIVYYYFTKANSQLEIFKNYPYEKMIDDLFCGLYKKSKKTNTKTIIYTEDSENRWFLKHMLKGYNNKIKLLPISISCQSLIDLMNVEPNFKNYIIVFDGDLKTKDKERIKNCKQNYLVLPTHNNEQNSPECEIHNFLYSDQADNYFNTEYRKNNKVKIEYFKEHELKGGKKNREAYKEWFKEHKDIFEDSNLMDYWIKSNKDIFNKFRKDFIKIYNRINGDNII